MLIEVPIVGPFPEYVEFFNEMGQLIRQPIQFEWMPSKCAHCNMLGNTSEVCKKKKSNQNRMEWRPILKPPVTNETSNTVSSTPKSEDASSPNQAQCQAPTHKQKVTQPDSGLSSSITSPPEKNLSTPTSTLDHVPIENLVIHPNPFKEKKLRIRHRVIHVDSIANWNIRGLNWPNKQEDVKIFLHENKIGLVGLLETKIKEHNVRKVASRLFHNWEWFHNFSLNHKGRIWIAWNPRAYRAQLLHMLDQLIHCKVTQLSTNKIFFLSMIYGKNHEAQRHHLCNDLQNIAQTMDEAWCLMGDFNTICLKEDRIGGNEVQDNDIWEIATLLDTCEIQELKSSGAYYSWTNKTIWSRIDHVFLNDLWYEAHHQHPGDQLIAKQEQEARERYISIMSSSMELIKQQCKIDWIKYGDDSTRLFFAKAKQSKLSTYIYTLKDQNGDQVEGFDQGAPCFVFIRISWAHNPQGALKSTRM
ncbi:LOW QUALITY PROTEIN: hypothetical protein Cgig2_019166 [Carnegiea gigantea]|uniref:Endonuclease/exonuclease/phosphatase domain-containing protein n=1 Tax=Carnegiea gigantea TaxID=171969 RepID=A0A9Q1GGZ1_9CARY|nr:LOW QUALITY PROTEIN: hypothetical protein Cgig2_019166 [Carnegiea gigantea]